MLIRGRPLRYLGHVLRMDADRTQSLLQRRWVAECQWMAGTASLQVNPRALTIPSLSPLYRSCLTIWDSASSMHASIKQERVAYYHNQTRGTTKLLAARAASRLPAQVASQRPSAVTKGGCITSCHQNREPKGHLKIGMPFSSELACCCKSLSFRRLCPHLAGTFPSSAQDHAKRWLVKSPEVKVP